MLSSRVASIIPKDETKDSVDFEEMVPWSKESTEENQPDHIIFPQELNLFLRDRIRDLTAENGCLRRLLAEMAEIKSQNRTENVTTKCLEENASNSNVAAATKIIKKIELKNDKREKKQVENPQLQSTEKSQAKQNDDDRVKYLTEKLQQTQAKLYESKNACASLKQEINKAQKLLCSEVGESVTISNLSNYPGGWRGRADQICILQQKITELQTRLSDFEGASKGSIVSMERKNLANLRNAEKERRQHIENSAKELRQAEVAIEGHKRKLEASKAKIKVLESELNTTKRNIAIMNEKRCHDDHLIEALNSRLKVLNTKHQEHEIEMRNQELKYERDYMNLKNELQSTQLQTDRLRRKLEEREIEIDKLRNPTGPNIEPMRGQKIVQLEMRSNLSHHAGPPLTNHSSCEPNEYVTLALAAEVERERLLEMITILNKRVDKERSDVNILSESLRNEKNKCSRLQLKLRKLETERVGIEKMENSYRTKLLPKSLKANEEFMNAEQARLKIELLQEECLALKVRLDTVQQDKAADLLMYKRMFDQIRKIFQDACRSNNIPPSTVGSLYTITN